MDILKRTIVLPLLFALLPVAVVQAQNDQTNVTVQALKGPLHLLQGRGGNVVASVGMDGVMLIDNDYAGMGEAYVKALAEVSQSDLSPGFVVNTHWHGDHSGNNEFWGIRGAVIIAHDNVRQRLSTPQEIKALDMKVEPSPAIALPIVTFAESMALHFNGGTIEVRHFPTGHTDGDSVVFYVDQNVVHMGDHFFKDAFPFVDLSSGGSVAGYIANIEKILSMVDEQTVIVPGHGSVANKADLERYLDMLKQTTSAIAAGLDGGKNVEQLTAAGLGDTWESWGAGFINEAAWIQTVAADR